LTQARARALDELEPQALAVALQAASQLVGQELRAQPGAFRAVVTKLLERLRHAHRVTLHVHPDDQSGLEETLAELSADAEQPIAVAVEVDSTLTQGDCVLRSDVGTIDARIDTRIDALARALARVSEDR